MRLSNCFVSLGRIVGPVLGGAVLDIHLSLPYISGGAIMFVGFWPARSRFPQVDENPLVRAAIH